MADIMITVDGNLSPIEQKIKKFQAQLQALQAANANSGARVTQLPKKVLSEIASPTIPRGVTQDNAAGIERAVRAQAKLVALKLKEADLNARSLTGQGIDYKREGAGSKRLLTAGGFEGLESSLDFKLGPEQRRKFRDEINSFYESLSAPLTGLSPEAAQKEFAKTSKTALAPLGIGPAKLRDVGVIDRENQQAIARTALAKRREQNTYGTERSREIEAGFSAERKEEARIARDRIAQEKAGAARAREIDSELAAAKRAQATALKEQVAYGTTRAKEIDDELNAAKRALAASLKAQTDYGLIRAREIDKQLGAGQGTTEQLAKYKDKQAYDVSAGRPMYGPGPNEAILAAEQVELQAKEEQAATAKLRAEQEAYGASRAAQIDAEIEAARLKNLTAEQRAYEAANPVNGPGRKEYNASLGQYDKAYEAAVKEAKAREAAAAELRADQEIYGAKRAAQIDTQIEAARRRRLTAEQRAYEAANPVLGPGRKEYNKVLGQYDKSHESAITEAKAREGAAAKLRADQEEYGARRAAQIDAKIEKSRQAAIAATPAYKTAEATDKNIESTQVNQELASSSAFLESQAKLGESRVLLTAAQQNAALEIEGLTASYAQGKLTQKQFNLAVQQALGATEGNAVVDAQTILTKKEQKLAALREANSEGKLAQANLELAAERKIASGVEAPRGFKAGFKQTEGGDAGAFFGKGLASTLKYAVPSAVLFGAFAGITDAVKDSEELAVVFTKLESQLNAMGEGDNISAITDDIIQLSKESGIAASDLGNVAIQLQGAFGNLKFNANDPTKSLGGLKGSDDIIRYGQEAVKAQLDAAAKLSVVTGIAQDELVDGLTAASFAFGASADRIGDVAVRLEANTGVLAKETISFLGDIGPSAREAGFSLEEVAALAAVVQQKSGQSGSAIAEQLTRVFAALGGNALKFYDLARSNKDAFGSQYEEFIKSVQGGDSKKTFNILANNFSELSKSSRDYVVELLGGQRQANTLLAAFGDSEGLSKAQEAAKNGAEGLDERYAKLQERISQIFKRLKAGFNELVKAIIDSGVGDAVAGIAGGFEKVFNLLGLMLSPLGSLNQLLDGTLSKVLGLGIQFLVIQKALKAIAGLNIATNVLGAVGGARASFASGGIGAVAGGLFSGSRAAYNASLASQFGGQFLLGKNLAGPNVRRSARAFQPLPGGYTTPGGIFVPPVQGPVAPIPNRLLIDEARQTGGKFAGAQARIKAGGAGLKTALGGSVGLGLLGVTGAFAAYDFIAGAIDEDKAKISQLRQDLSQSKKSSEQLIKEAREMRVKRSGWYNFWHFLFDQPTPDDVKEVAGIVKQYKKGITQATQANSLDSKALDKLILGDDKNTKSNLFERSGRQGVDLTAGVSSTVTSSGGEQIDVGVSEEDENDLERLRDIYKRLGLANEVVNAQVGKILLSTEDKVGGLKKLIDDEKVSPEVAAQASRLLDAITKTGILDPNTAQIFADISDPTKKLLNSSNETLLTNIESIKAAFDSGGLSLSDYVNALREEIKFLEGKRDAPGGELTAEEVKALQKAQKDITDAFTKDILNRQERDIEIAKLLGAEDAEVDLRSVQNNLDNLNNPNFKDPEEKRKAALAVLSNSRAFYDHVLETTTDIALAQKMLDEGFEIPAVVRETFLNQNVQASDQYQTVAKYVQNLRTSGRNDPQMAALLTRYGIDKNKGPGQQLEDFLAEYFSAEGVSAETISNYQKQYDGLQNELANNKNLTEPQKANIRGQVQFIGEILGFAKKEWSFGPAIDPVTGKANTFGERLGLGGKTLFGEKPLPLTADSTQEEKKKFADQVGKVEDAKFNLAKAIANGNAVEIAAISKQQATAALKRAQSLEGLDGEAARLDAMADQVKADQEMVNAIKAVNDAKFGLAKAVAEDAGDTIGAANIDVQQAQADLALAKSTGDAAGVASAQAAIIQARKGVRDAVAAQRDAQAEYLKAVLTKDDPVKQAQFDLNLAKIQEQEARGATEKANAALKVLEAERALRDAMSETRQAIFNLREAQLKSLDDDVGAANVAAQAARAQLADAIARGAGSTEIANLQAGVINADKQARDTLLQTKLDDYKYLLDTGKITKSQYIKYLEQVQQTLAPGSKAFKDLELTLRQLKNDIGQDLQANLPTSFDLPTLYEVRRLNQTGTQGGAPAGQSIGYQDNRQVDVQITIGQNMSAEQITTVLADALGTGRNGSGARRY